MTDESAVTITDGQIERDLESPIDSWQHDAFNSRPLVQRVIRMIKKPERPLLAIYGRWGAGKSSLLNLCQSEVKDQHNETIFWMPAFNAWEIERVADLPTALMYHIKQNFPSDLKNGESIKEKALKIVGAFSVLGLNYVGTKVGIDKLGNQIKDGVQLDQFMDLADPYKQCETLERVKNDFEGFSKLLIKELVNEGPESYIVVPIDDLDRCSPESAIQFIFALKHLLTPKSRFRFLVTVDRHAMSKFLNLNYGSAFTKGDASWFMEKIFNDWVELVTPSINQYIDYLNLKMKDPILDKQFWEQVKNSGIPRIAGSTRQFIRGYNRFREYFIDFEKQGVKPQNSQALENQRFNFLICLGWFLLYSCRMDELDAIFASEGLGGKSNNFEKVFAYSIHWLNYAFRKDENVDANNLLRYPLAEQFFYQEIRLIQNQKKEVGSEIIKESLPNSMKEYLISPHSLMVHLICCLAELLEEQIKSRISLTASNIGDYVNEHRNGYTMLANELNQTLIGVKPYL